MGAPERAQQWTDEAASMDGFSGAVPRVSYEDWAEVGAAQPDTHWCVDDGTTIACLTSRELWDAVSTRRMPTDTRVWREGFGHWHALAEILEAEERITVPERSEIRLRARPFQTLPCELTAEPAASLQSLRTWLGRLRARLARWGRSFGATPTPFLAACAGVVVGAAAALSLWCAIASWQQAHPPVVSPLERSP
jgi:hypothetical protein